MLAGEPMIGQAPAQGGPSLLVCNAEGQGWFAAVCPLGKTKGLCWDIPGMGLLQAPLS